jgi:hypothetical protein
MSNLLIHPTQTAVWHALVNEAESASRIQLEVELESYLVFLLMRFSEKPELVASVLGLDFLEGTQAIGQKPYLLKDVGDKCMLFAGLFPERAKRRRVTPTYFIRLGQTAYSTLSSTLTTNDSEFFATLCGRFVVMIDVLHATRDIATKNNEFNSLKPLLNFQRRSH